MRPTAGYSRSPHLPRVGHRWIKVDGGRSELPYLVIGDEQEPGGEAWWRVTDRALLSDGRMVSHGFGPPRRIVTRCEPDGRVRQPVDRRAVQLEHGEWRDLDARWMPAVGAGGGVGAEGRHVRMEPEAESGETIGSDPALYRRARGGG